MHDVRIIQTRSLFRSDDPALDGATQNFLSVQSASVVGNLDYDLITLVISIQTYGSVEGFRAACRSAAVSMP